MTITPKPHERKGHYLPFVNKPPVSGQFLSCQLRQSVTNPSCFESRLWSVSSFNAPCHPYSLWRFSSGSLKHDILPQRAGTALSQLSHAPWSPGNIHGTIGQGPASYAKILTRFPAQPPVMFTHSACREFGGPEATVVTAFGRCDLSSAPQHSLEAQSRCCVPTGLFRSCVRTGGFTVKSPGSVKKRPE